MTNKLTTTHDNHEVVPLYINGNPLPLEPSLIYPVINAASNRTVHYAQSASVSSAIAACDAAASAFPSWSGTPYWKRRAILLAAADLFVSSADDLGAMQSLETSCTPTYGRFLARTAAPIIREIAGSMSAALSGNIPPLHEEHTRVYIHKEAVGPVLMIPPWNSPNVLGPRSLAAALAAGCTVVLKASELCPLLYRMLVDVFERSGMPRGVINQVQVRREDAAAVTEALIAHPAIRKVEFIGSANVGRIIGQLGGKYLKPVLMELGGKTPAIVLGDADLESAARNVAFGAFCHHGQICFATSRVIVVREIAEPFIDLLKKEVEAKYAEGLGSAATKAFALSAQAIVEAARRDGAEFLIGNNELIGPNKATLTPTVLVGVKPSSLLADEEAFGPSTSLFVVEDVEEAVRVANGSKYGLTATVWTENTALALDLSARLDYGVVHINSCSLSDLPVTPVQGHKASGWGSNNAGYGINEFLELKTVTIRPASSPAQFQG